METPFDEVNAALSPDGRWLAYQSNESGQHEVYVRPFPDVTGGRWQISTSGGSRPLWSSDGRELFYMATGGTVTAYITTAGTLAAIMRVPIGRDGAFNAGVPVKLFEGPYFFASDVGTTGFGRTYDVSADGQRFLMVKEAEASETSAAARIVIVQNWFEELKRLVPSN
jgi:serine/threonine-protein kinase